VEKRVKKQRSESTRCHNGNAATTDKEEKSWNYKDFASRRVSFQVVKRNNSYFRAGDYGKKRVLFFCQTQENDKNFIELYNSQTPPRITHTNKLICLFKENHRVVYTGEKEN
jgi:hypothetical protein